MSGKVDLSAAAPAGLSFTDSLKAFPSYLASKTANAVSSVLSSLSTAMTGTVSGIKKVCAKSGALCSQHPKVATAGLAAISLVGAAYGLNKMGYLPTTCFTAVKK